MEHIRGWSGEFCRDEAEVEVRAMLAFSLLIGNPRTPDCPTGGRGGLAGASESGGASLVDGVGALTAEMASL